MFLKSLKIFVILFILFTSSINAQRKTIYPDSLITKIDTNTIDVKIFRAINNIQSIFLNIIIPISSESIYYTTTLIPITVLWTSRNNNNYYDENSMMLLGLSEILTLVSTCVIKNIKKEVRPYETLPNVYTIPGNIPHKDKYSFPSGHTSMSFSMATSLTLRYPDKPVLITGLYLYSTIVSLGRIYLGVHYPSDVLAGMLIGSGSAALVYSFRKEFIKLKNNVFCEKGREDINQKSVSTALIFTSFIATDILGYVLGKVNNKIFNSNNIRFDLRGYENNVNFKYGF